MLITGIEALNKIHSCPFVDIICTHRDYNKIIDWGDDMFANSNPDERMFHGSYNSNICLAAIYHRLCEYSEVHFDEKGRWDFFNFDNRFLFPRFLPARTVLSSTTRAIFKSNEDAMLFKLRWSQ